MTIDRSDELAEWYAEDDADLGPRDHDALIAEAVAASDREVWPSPSAPLAVAHRLYRDWRDDTGTRTLLCHRGTWMQWHGPHWAEMDTAALRKHIYDRLGTVNCLRAVRKGGEVERYEAVRWDPNKRKIADVLEAAAAVGHISADVDPPAWLDTGDAGENSFSAHGKPHAGQFISCRNGLLDLSTRTVSPHTPTLFNVVSVPFDYQRDVSSPIAWLKFLASVWPDDAQSVALLQEYTGYILSGRTDMQKMLLLIGPTRSGKGTFTRMLASLVGRGHVAGPTLASLGTNFGLSPLLGKPLAVISDARLGSTPAHAVVERLLSITGEDMLTVDRKYREPWSGKMPTRFVVLSNELPRFKDSSGAIANRLLIAQMTNSFLGREDRTLDRQLAGELPGILNWALQGLDRLTNNGRFTVPSASEEATNLMMDLASPVSAFVREKCRRAPDAVVERDVLYAVWKQWAEDNGHLAGAKSTFGRDLHSVVPGLKQTQPRINKVQVRHYVGIALAPVSPVSDEETAAQRHDSDTGSQQGVLCQGDTPVELEAGSPAADTGRPVSPGVEKPQASGGDTGDTGQTPLKSQHQTVHCTGCDEPIPEHMHSSRARGTCSRCAAKSNSKGKTHA